MSTQLTHLSPHQGRLIERQSPDRVPNCQRCHRPMKLVGESSETWQWGCEPCGCAHVFTKPRAREAAQYRVKMERVAQRQTRERQHNARPKYFLLGGK